MNPQNITFTDVRAVRGHTWDRAEIPDWIILTEDADGHYEFAFTVEKGKFYRADGTRIRARWFAVLTAGGGK